jgi:hypothetical protein
MTLDYVKIPVSLYQLKISSLLELSILSLALSFGDTGLVLSNRRIAELFNSDRTSIIRAISRLVAKGYLRRVGNKLHRKLIVDSNTLLLCDSSKSPPKMVALQALNSGASATHNTSKVKRGAHKEKSLCDESFQRFWEAYPKKQKRIEAQKTWAKLNPSEELTSRIIKDVERRRDTFDWTKENRRYCPLPSSYINGQRWDDQIESTEPTTAPLVRDKDGLTPRQRFAKKTGVPI